MPKCTVSRPAVLTEEVDPSVGEPIPSTGGSVPSDAGSSVVVVVVVEVDVVLVVDVDVVGVSGGASFPDWPHVPRNSTNATSTRAMPATASDRM
jgi:hypothetical protein|tara:strand:+ start:92 stop:373 length:282 start_codon:yes stop_codon:yes gene_type:complete